MPILNNQTKIKIVDSMMGTGKSTWVFRLINSRPDTKFFCVVPTLDECERYRNKIQGGICEPQRYGTKQQHFKQLVRSGENIVTTHELIRRLDAEALELLRNNDYTLIIDECLQVFSPYPLTADDTAIIFNEELVYLDNDGFLKWNETKDSYKGHFDHLKKLCDIKALMGYTKNDGTLAPQFMWSFPVQFFQSFSETYILTYLWEGSLQKVYFDMHNIPYAKRCINRLKWIAPYNDTLNQERIQKVRQLINIYEGSLNKIGDVVGKTKPLTKNWYKSQSRKNTGLLEILKHNTENYFRTQARTASKENMFTTFKTFKPQIAGHRYARGFIPCNATATNKYREKASLAYLINFYPPPELSIFAESRGIEFDYDTYALSALLQWIWRSRIREDKPINLYIPSERMRTLLTTWLGIDSVKTYPKEMVRSK